MDWHRKRKIITGLFLGGIGLLIALAGVSIYLDARSVRQNAALSDIRNPRLPGHESTGGTDRHRDRRAAAILIAGDPVYLEPFLPGPR